MQELQTIQNESSELINQANQYLIIDQPTYENAANLKKQLSLFKSKINGIFAPIVKKAHEAHKEAKATQKKYIEPIDEAERIVLNKCKAYEDEQEKIRLAEQKKAQEEAEQKVKDEAEFAEAHGLDEDHAEPPPSPPKVKIKPKVDKVSGIGIRRTWKFDVIDETKVPREYLKLDLVKIGEIVRKNKDKTNIPGVKTYYD